VNIRVVTLGTRPLSRGKTIAVAIAALAVGGIFLALGIALLASLALVGTVVAAAVAIARLVRGRGRPSLPARERSLDPSMEVFPPADGEGRHLEGGPEAR
jgi:membrane protein implicated in regulation of membrane protease activity